MKLWIRVDADTPRDPLWDMLGTATGHTAVSAFGYAVRVWCAMAEHCPDGDISDIPDATIERWAGWEEGHKVFVTAFRDLCAQNGVVYAFADRQVKLAEQREKERIRKQKQREKRANVPRDVPPPVPKLSHHNGTERNVKKNTSSRTTWLTPAMQAWEAKFGAKSFPFGAAAKHLAPLNDGDLTPDQIGFRLAAYLGSLDDLKYASLPRFAATHGQYANGAPPTSADAEYARVAAEATDASQYVCGAAQMFTGPDGTRTYPEGGSGLGGAFPANGGASA